jgi:hypothetical protein
MIDSTVHKLTDFREDNNTSLDQTLEITPTGRNS